MLRETTRQLTQDERANYAAQIGVRKPVARALNFALITIASLGILSASAIAIAPDLPSKLQNELAGLFLVIGVTVAVLVDQKTRCPPRSRRFMAELKRGIGVVQVYEAVEAVRVTEFEDNGYAFYLKLTDGNTLYLVGQYLYELTDQKKFPSTKLEVVYSPVSNLILSLTCRGSYLAPTRELPPPTPAEFESHTIPDDGAVFALDFESLKHK